MITDCSLKNVLEWDKLSYQALRGNFGFSKDTIEAIRIVGEVYTENGTEEAEKEIIRMIGQGAF